MCIHYLLMCDAAANAIISSLLALSCIAWHFWAHTHTLIIFYITRSHIFTSAHVISEITLQGSENWLAGAHENWRACTHKAQSCAVQHQYRCLYTHTKQPFCHRSAGHSLQRLDMAHTFDGCTHTHQVRAYMHVCNDAVALVGGYGDQRHTHFGKCSVIAAQNACQN